MKYFLLFIFFTGTQVFGQSEEIDDLEPLKFCQLQSESFTFVSSFLERKGFQYSNVKKNGDISISFFQSLPYIVAFACKNDCDKGESIAFTSFGKAAAAYFVNLLNDTTVFEDLGATMHDGVYMHKFKGGNCLIEMSITEVKDSNSQRYDFIFFPLQ